MEKLTYLQEVLLGGLMKHGVSEDSMIGILLMLTEGDCIEDMLWFLADNPTATREEILAAVVKMLDTKEASEAGQQNTTPER